MLTPILFHNGPALLLRAAARGARPPSTTLPCTVHPACTAPPPASRRRYGHGSSDHEDEDDLDLDAGSLAQGYPRAGGGGGGGGDAYSDDSGDDESIAWLRDQFSGSAKARPTKSKGTPGAGCCGVGGGRGGGGGCARPGFLRLGRWGVLAFSLVSYSGLGFGDTFGLYSQAVKDKFNW